MPAVSASSWTVSFFALALACGCSSSPTSAGVTNPGTRSDLSTAEGPASNRDGSALPDDAASGATPDAAASPSADAGSAAGDGTPTRQQCTSDWGTKLSATHGRLDGYLVSIVPPGSMSACNDDTSHVHLQVMMQGAIYDVAVDTGSSGDDIYYLTKSLPLGNDAWAEGWHTSDALSYASLGLSSTDFAELSPTDAPTTVENALATVNHISVYGTGYNTNGMHLVHYESGEDGALVLEPQSANPQYLFFRFSTDKF